MTTVNQRSKITNKRSKDLGQQQKESENKKMTTEKTTPAKATEKKDAKATKTTPDGKKRGRKPGQKVVPHDQHNQIAKLNKTRETIVAKYQARLAEVDKEIERRYQLQVERDEVLTARERAQAERAERRTERLLATEKGIQESLAKLRETTNAPEIDSAELTALGVTDDELLPLEVADSAEIILD